MIIIEIINKKLIIIIAIIVIIISVSGIIYFVNNSNKEFESFEDSILNESDVKNEIIEEVKQKIVVHISGQVNNLGIVILDEGARIVDAIEAAGGITNKADLSKVNLAFILEDAQKIYIPSIDDKEEEYISSNSGNNVIVSNEKSNKKEGKLMININTANQDELEKLPGIGNAIANRIVDYRKDNGKFNSIEDIKNVSGIGDNKFNNIKQFICIK